MNSFIRLFVFSGFLLLLPVTSTLAQTPNASLPFAREPNKENTTDYVLKPNTAEIQKRVGPDKPYRIVGIVARPSSQLAVMLFVNSQKDFQLIPQTDHSVIITVDQTDIKDLTYEIAAHSEDKNSKLEIGNILIRLADLRRIAKGSSVTIKLGVVVHQLDADNLAALRYLIGEIDSDESKGK